MTKMISHGWAKLATASFGMPFVVACFSIVLFCAPLSAQAQTTGSDAKVWVPAMKKVNAKFSGEQGTLALFGDSITVSRAFWFGLQSNRKNASADMTKAFELVNNYMFEDCWDRRGPWSCKRSKWHASRQRLAKDGIALVSKFQAREAPPGGRTSWSYRTSDKTGTASG